MASESAASAAGAASRREKSKEKQIFDRISTVSRALPYSVYNNTPCITWYACLYRDAKRRRPRIKNGETHEGGGDDFGDGAAGPGGDSGFGARLGSGFHGARSGGEASRSL